MPVVEPLVSGSDELHILRLSPYYYLPGRQLSRRELQYEPIGGMQVQIAQATEALDALGLSQTVVLPRRPGQAKRITMGRASVLRNLRLPIAPLRTRSKGYIGLLVSWGMSVTVWALVQRVRPRERYSIIHAHCSELPWIPALAVVAKKVLRRPLVLTTHCSAIATFHPETLLGKILAGPARVAERAALRRADAVVVLTERIRRVYIAQGLVPAHRLHVVPDGVRMEVFSPASYEAPPPGIPMVLYCGRFAPEKGWADFVAAADLIAKQGIQARFVLCGDGNEMPHCRRELERRGITETVTLMGHVDRAEVALLMSQAAVVVVPSRHEELGGTVLEALAMGRAVVATMVGGLPEVVIDGETGLLVPPHDPESLAAAVARLIADPDLRERLGQAATKQVGAFDSTVVARDLLAVYRAVASPPVLSGRLVRQLRRSQPLAHSALGPGGGDDQG